MFCLNIRRSKRVYFVLKTISLVTRLLHILLKSKAKRSLISWPTPNFNQPVYLRFISAILFTKDPFQKQFTWYNLTKHMCYHNSSFGSLVYSYDYNLFPDVLLQESSRGRRRRGWRLSATRRPASTPRATSGRGDAGRATAPTPDRTAAGPTAGFRPGYSPATLLASTSRRAHAALRRRRESPWTSLRSAGRMSRDSGRELVEQNTLTVVNSQDSCVVIFWGILF